jgi:hypothetical protein
MLRPISHLAKIQPGMALLVATLAVAGCAEGSVAPGTLPKGATSGVYTTADAQTVASCIATAIGGTVQPSGDRLVIVSTRRPDLRYSVGVNSGSIYPTQIAVTGVEGDTPETKRVDACVVSRESAQ